MPEFITLAEVLKHIDSGQPFDMEAVQADVARGTGGAIRTYTKAVKWIAQQLPGKEAAKAATATATPKNPSHYKNSTRNIYLPETRQMRKVHIRLITKFNGKQVS